MATKAPAPWCLNLLYRQPTTQAFHFIYIAAIYLNKDIIESERASSVGNYTSLLALFNLKYMGQTTSQ